VANILTRILVWPYEQWFLRTRNVGAIEGVVLIDYYKNTLHFRETFASALEGLRHTDPRRYERVRLYIRYIMNFPIGYSGAGYIQHLKAFATSFQPPPSEAAVRKSAIWYASMLVHEATHGLLHARNIPFNSRSRERVEQLCSKEEHRFLDRAGLTPESLAKIKSLRSYHPELYRKRWSSSPWRLFRESFRYTKQEKAKTKDQEQAALDKT